MKPNSNRRNSDPAYLLELLERAGLSQREAARLIGITDRMLRYYLSDDPAAARAPYPVQFALEQLAR